MAEEEKQLPKSGLPEALDPEIGNGCFWETNPHFLNLRGIDPSKVLETAMIDESESSRILGNWSENSGGKSDIQEFIPPVSIPIEESPEKPKGKGKKKHKKIHSVTKAIETAPEWMQEEEPVKSATPFITRSDQERPVEEIIPEVEQVHPVKPGKRVRKAVKVAEEERKKVPTIKTAIPPTPMDSTLSPFTRWLKGLKGSEYVHPYEDDYALDQRSGATKDGISETFADLLAAQGYRDQAIDMYRLLMAKYPEKSSFFAAKIEAL